MSRYKPALGRYWTCVPVSPVVTLLHKVLCRERTVFTPMQEERKQAQEALAYIRQTMESASSFTALSGWGLVAVGVVGLAAAGLAWRTGWPAKISVWIPAALLGVVCAGAANAMKAR